MKEKELYKDSVVKNYFTTAQDGKDYLVSYYSLDMILAIGFRVRGKRGTQMFFAQAQNKLLYAVTGKTAAEVILDRANAQDSNMGLTSWKGNIVRKQDIIIAKNYLTMDEIDTLNRLVVIFLETAELRAKNKTALTMDFWKDNIDKILEFNDKPLLKNHGKITHKQMEDKVKEIYAIFDKNRKEIEASIADKEDLNDLEQLEKEIKSKSN